MALSITSPVFSDGEAIPRRFTCEGDDISPPLAWTGIPEGTKSLVLIVDDPDAPDPEAPRMTWVHWVLYNLTPDSNGLAVGGEDISGHTSTGLNDWKKAAYGGPCPPIGRHRYFHKLYALDTVLSGLDNPTKTEVEQAMKGHILADATLVGTYQKSA